jgi:tRNA pseudouridine55 synthase
MIDGALLLDKPVGISSNRALQEAKKLLKAKKAGHAGTLDPLASGLLILLFGEATKLAGPLLDGDKAYLATVKLGEKTTTGDAEGEIIQRRPYQGAGSDIPAVLERFRGEIEQVPPMYSALKREGVPLYALARSGRTVERAARRVRIIELDMLRFAPPHLELRIVCSKGTYVRALAEDIGEALGSSAHLTALRRTGSGRWRVEDAATLEALSSQAERRVLPPAALLADLPRAELDSREELRLRNGQALETSIGEGTCAAYGEAGHLIGLAEVSAGVLRPVRLLAPSQAADKPSKTL